MGNLIRWIQPYQVYELTMRTVDRQFLFKPNHHPKNPLLADSCPLDALNMNNDIIPDSSIINTIGSAVGRALEKYPVQIHCFESNITHLHEKFSVNEEQRGNLPSFLRSTHSLIARGVNKTWEREGHLFAARSRFHPCLDDQSAEQKLIYAVTNTVKDNLVDTVAQSPFFSTYSHQAFGDDLRFWYIDYEAYWAAGGDRKQGHRLKNYLRWVTWECTPLPNHAGRTMHQRRTWLRQQVRDAEKSAREKRKSSGGSVIGKKRLFEEDPRNRPENPKKSSKEPLCHASDPELVKEYKKSWREFLDSFIPASADYRNGYFDREFPDGSFRPPLISIYSASAL